MARPRSEDKPNAILEAAAEVIAEMGLAAPTARIAKIAGVAEGTLFTYFPSKDSLFNELYRGLKAELHELILCDFPLNAPVRTRARHAWRRYIAWGVANPVKRKAMSRLTVCERISEACKEAIRRDFAPLSGLMEESMAEGVLINEPTAFGSGILVALAEMTMEFIASQPERAEQYADAGFEAFWRAIDGRPAPSGEGVDMPSCRERKA